MNEPVRIAMWSGPRNISTALMRSFEHRADTVVIDEPFYAAYLAATGLDHPMRAEVLAAQPQDWQAVATLLTGPAPNGAPLWYQKHMTHHMVDGFGLAWSDQCRNAFLIRSPERVLASYRQKRAEVTLADLGFVQQARLFDRAADRLGHAPPVIEGSQIRARPEPALRALCAALGIAFDPAMLGWPAGPRPTDGVWAPAWYDAVQRSTGFDTAAEPAEPVLDDALRRIADAARPHYARLAMHRLVIG